MTLTTRRAPARLRLALALRHWGLTLATGLAAAATTAALASGGRAGAALLGGILGAMGALASSILLTRSQETRWIRRWPHLVARGWWPSRPLTERGWGGEEAPAGVGLPLPLVDLYDAAESAQATIVGLRALLGARIEGIALEVDHLVRQGEAAFDRWRRAVTWLSAAGEVDEVGPDVARAAPEVAHWVGRSARARRAATARVEREGRQAQAALGGARALLDDLTLRLERLDDTLEGGEVDLAPALAGLHTRARGLERALDEVRAARPPADSNPLEVIP